jgi:hypothetical protein
MLVLFPAEWCIRLPVLMLASGPADVVSLAKRIFLWLRP